ncbi:hypothetical protein CALVIDRAFT_557067 [Calocera viscosa TUFC12733]|uniref:Uncharacterized protein n=1 Tax=Calocera viscosa (strain TUFC12733) TaxID=1330018 RepID=A0A167JB18_CALVF|nr:hypothetical protein CALVIDRAFT_557067 [Calocera viscosa TUFC12733]
MPEISEYFHFDRNAYWQKIRTLPHHELQLKEQGKRRNKIGAATGIGASVAAAPFTFGLSLGGAALSARAFAIEKDKLYLLQYEMYLRGLPALEATARDWIIPFGTHMGGIFAGGGIGLGLEHAIAPVATPAIHALASTTATHPVQFDVSSAANGFVNGVSHTSHGIAAAATGHAGNVQQACMRVVEPRSQPWVGVRIPGAIIT